MVNVASSEQQSEDQRLILELVAQGNPLLDTLEAISRFVERHEPDARCAILIVSADKHCFSTCVSPSFPVAFREALNGISIDPPFLGSCGSAVTRGELTVVGDVARDQTYSQLWRELLLACGSQALSSHPIRDGGTVVGCLSVHYSEPQGDLPKNAALIQAASHLAALAIHRQTAQESFERRSRRADMLCSIAQRLVVVDDPKLDLKPAFDAVRAEIGADLYFNYGIDPDDDQKMVLLNSYGIAPELQSQFSRLRLGELVCGEVAATRQAIILSDIDRDETERTATLRRLDACCCAAFPLVARGRLHGTVAFISLTKRAFTSDSISLIEAVATQLAAALERRHLQKEKAVGEQQMALVTDAMPSLMGIIGQDGRYEYVNAAYERWFNLPPDKIIGQHLKSVLGPSAWAIIGDRIERALKGERVKYESDIVYARGGARYICAEYIPRPTGTGSNGCYVLVHDLTDRKRHEEALASNERALSDLIEKAPFGIYIVDRNLRIVRTNRQSQLGAFRSIDHVVGSDLAEVMHTLWPADVAETVVAQFKKTLETGVAYQSKDFIEPRKDVYAIEAYEWELHRITLPDGTFGVVCYYFDSTRIRKAETQARESEQRFRHMADNAPVMIWVTEVDGSCSYLSQPWYDFTGQSEVEGLGIGWLEAVHPEDRIAAKQAFVAANDERQSLRLEYRLRRKDGAYVWCIDAAAPRFDGDGRFLGYIGSVIDISERKQAEDTQWLLLSELNHRVKNTLANVQAIAQQTLRRTRDPSSFVASFTGRLQSLSKAHSMLSQTTWQGADLKGLINDQLSMGPVDLQFIEIEGSNITLAPQMALHLALVLHELGTNSIKYGALSVHGGRVSISWKVTDGELWLQWAERGGPPVKVLGPRGFGTTVIEQSAKSEGGEAMLSLQDGSLTWQLRLPLHRVTKLFSATSSSGTRVPDAEPRRQEIKSLRVLVIEDEPLVAMELVDIIQDAGAKAVGPVSSCAAALQTIRAGGFDLAVLDGNLLGEPVDEVAAALTRARVPFLFISGYGRESLPRSYSHAPLIGKPFNGHSLIDALCRLTQMPTTLSIIEAKPKNDAEIN